MIEDVAARAEPRVDLDVDADAAVRRVELVISTLLRVGVVASLAVVVVGTVITFVQHPSYLSSHAAYHRLTGRGATFPHTLPDVVRGIRHGQGSALVAGGLLLLIATPVVRVAVSIFAFVYQHDRTFVVITSVVLCLLLVSFVLGRAGG